MQTSSGGNKVARTVVKAIVAVAVVLGLNAGIAFALEPGGTLSAVVWTDYRDAEEVDTLFVGNSLMNAAINPNEYDELMGTSSLNLATPSQSVEETYETVRGACERFDVHRVVLGVSLNELRITEPASPWTVFMRQRAGVVPAQDTVLSTADILFRYNGASGTDSINCLFPWLKAYAGPNLSDVLANIRFKCSGLDAHEAAEAHDGSWTYCGKGYGAYDVEIDYDTGAELYFTEEHSNATDMPFDEAHAHALTDLCDYCVDRGIDVVVITPPYPLFTVLYAGEGFYSQDEMMRSLVEAHGATFYDFNLAPKELLDVDPAGFSDYEHLNGKGALELTRAFAEVIGQRDAGEDVSGMFLTPEEHVASVADEFSAVIADMTVEDDAIVVEAHPLAGVDADIEYQLCVKQAGTDEWAYESEWGSSPDFTVTPDMRGDLSVRVNARIVGDPSVRHFNEQALYY